MLEYQTRLSGYNNSNEENFKITVEKTEKEKENPLENIVKAFLGTKIKNNAM